jgi:hypothetical protein
MRSGSEQERDLQAKMQHLISLQHQEQEQQHYDESYGAASSGIHGSNRRSFTRGSKQQNLQTYGKQQQQLPKPQPPQQQQFRESSSSDDYVDEGFRAPHSSIRDSNNPQVPQHPYVGKGTIVFSGKLRDFSNKKKYGNDYAQLQQPLHLQQSPSSSRDSLTASKPPPSTSSYPLSLPPHQQTYSGYGSLSQQLPQQDHQHHEFHYGNPDYHDPYDKSDMHSKDLLYNKNDHLVSQLGHRSTDRPCCCQKICCLYRPFVKIIQQENFHRSFCFGAIDGLLTGSGIVSAFWGLGALSVRTTWEVRLAVVALAVAACVADSLCMALGHVWTTYVVTSNHDEERSRVRSLLETNKSQAKGKLVDMLLARGMLKIDAMSLADTLEGYPDLLISALVGDSLLVGVEEVVGDDQTEDGFDQNFHGNPIDTPECQQHQHHWSSDPAMDTGSGPLESFGSWKLPSYGQFHLGHSDSESRHSHTVLRESQTEGLFMMVGFSVFASLPSLLWLFLPLWLQSPPDSRIDDHGMTSAPSSSTTTSTTTDSPMVALPSLIIFILSAVVWCLGVWKSRFVDANWMIFGMETIAVLLVCVFSSYYVAMVIASFLGLETAHIDKLLPNEFALHDL